MTNKVLAQLSNTVAVKLKLEGRALIEASAGTGKTWTLTGVILRLLIEARRPVKDIVASTFTRAAAAEMRQRIQARVQTFRQLLITLLLASKDDPAFLSDDDDLLSRVDHYLMTNAPQTYANDDVNRYLIISIVQKDGLNGLLAAYRLSELALAELNKLFVGTLDSLCQRWLREFATETGMSEQVSINEESDALEIIVHQQLRRIQHDYVQQSDLHQQTICDNKADIDDLLPTMKQLMAFGRINIQQAQSLDFAETAYRQAYQALCEVTKAEIEKAVAFINDEAIVQHLNKGKKFYKNRQSLTALYAALTQQLTLDTPLKALADAISEVFTDENSTPFNKSGKHLRDPFIHLTLLKRIHEYYQYQLLAEQQKTIYQDAIKEQIALAVRTSLPQALEARGEGMFSLQLERLNRVLEGEHGDILARYIAHRYPVMLVDESQDLNHEQAKMLQSIYLREDNHQGFLLLVGDPKQAIYGFRGGDVANYNRLKKQFSVLETLTANRRSSEHLVDALNEFYLPVKGLDNQTEPELASAQSQPDSAILGDGIYYQAMSTAGATAREIATVGQQAIARPATWYHVEEVDDEFRHITNIIQTITSPQSRYYRVKDEKPYPIRYQDIMVLMPNHVKLQTLQRQLLNSGINAQLKTSDSVFDHLVAQEFAYILSLMLDPYHDGQMRRLLSGRLLRLTMPLSTSAEAGDQKHHDQWIAHYRQLFIRAGETWQQYGLLRALQDILTHPIEHDDTLWTRVAGYTSPDNLRYLLDMRHCLQIIVDKSRQLSPRQLHHWWLEQLADPPNGEWAQAHPLPTLDAVKLLTLHGAKGLQAPVVIVGSATNRSREPKLYLYHDESDGLYLSFAKMPAAEEKAAAIREYEKRRLLYVGLTRAEDLLFIGRHQKPAKSYAALYHAHYYQAEAPIHVHSQSLDEETVQTIANELSTPNPIAFAQDVEDVHSVQESHTLRHQSFRGWGKSSFSALLRHYGHHQQDFMILQPDYQQQNERVDAVEMVEEIADSVRFQFPKGVDAGSFLHETLECLPPQRTHWRKFLAKMLAKYQLLPTDDLEQYIGNIAQWLEDILHTPLSASGVTIQSIPQANKIHELSFNLGINDSKPIDLPAISKLFAQYGLSMPLTPSKTLTRFVRGEIDLVYRHDDKYYVVDYKSNYLSGHLAGYDEPAMRQTMDKHQYWLQAAIYQLALHRFLSTRLSAYDPHIHLGGVEYAFLRGMSVQQPQYGKLVWHIPIALIEQLDTVFGYQEAYHA